MLLVFWFSQLVLIIIILRDFDTIFLEMLSFFLILAVYKNKLQVCGEYELKVHTLSFYLRGLRKSLFIYYNRDWKVNSSWANAVYGAEEFCYDFSYVKE